MNDRPRILVTEKIADAGIEVLRAVGDVDVELEWSADELAERIAPYNALVVRSATKVTAALIAAAPRLEVVGRAGTGVDNVDVAAATERGIVVVNAAGSNAVSAAEHAIALMLAQARNIPQAHMALVDGRWERSKFGGIEVTGKTLGVIGFGNIGQLVAERALGLGMRVVAYDPFVADARYREMGVEKAESLDDLYPDSDFITLHVASTPETRGFINAEAIAKMRDGVRIINDARGDLIVEADLVAAIESGKVAGAAIDVYPEEPATESPYFGVGGIVVTPHLGASTGEAQERAGVACAQQVAAALTGGAVTSAVNIPVVSAETMATVGPFLPLAGHLGRLAAGIAGGIDGSIEVTCEGEIAEHDTRLLVTAVLAGALSGHTVETVNMVNAAERARERGIEWSDSATTVARDYTSRLKVAIGDASVAGTTVGSTSRPRLVEVLGESIELELAPHVGILRYRDEPGQIGTVGTVMAGEGINIASMAVGRSTEGQATMGVTVDSPVPAEAQAAIAKGCDAQVWFVDLDIP
ncbi:MAG: phosphoglycerate dehydrogenase [Thermoleophilia bacterium]|nr:phosphoglycerate dehydrogenase [Thermoleophilia bacterium]